jgi:hypothetical protein
MSQTPLCIITVGTNPGQVQLCSEIPSERHWENGTSARGFLVQILTAQDRGQGRFTLDFSQGDVLHPSREADWALHTREGQCLTP